MIPDPPDPPIPAAPLNYAPPTLAPQSTRPAHIAIAAGTTLNLIAAAYLVYANFEALWSIPPGTPIRPMALFALQLGGGALALFVSTLLSILAVALAWRHKRIWLLAALLFLMGFAPVIAAFVSYRWIIDTHSLQLES